MNGNHRDLAWAGPAGSADWTHRSDDRDKARVRLNWALALSTVPGAAIVMLFVIGAMMRTDACTASRCPRLGAGVDFDVLFYGPPAVALLVIGASVYSAKRRGGLAVPLAGLAMLVADVGLLAAGVAQI